MVVSLEMDLKELKCREVRLADGAKGCVSVLKLLLDLLIIIENPINLVNRIRSKGRHFIILVM